MIVIQIVLQSLSRCLKRKLNRDGLMSGIHRHNDSFAFVFTQEGELFRRHEELFIPPMLQRWQISADADQARDSVF